MHIIRKRVLDPHAVALASQDPQAHRQLTEWAGSDKMRRSVEQLLALEVGKLRGASTSFQAVRPFGLTAWTSDFNAARAGAEAVAALFSPIDYPMRLLLKSRTSAHDTLELEPGDVAVFHASHDIFWQIQTEHHGSILRVHYLAEQATRGAIRAILISDEGFVATPL